MFDRVFRIGTRKSPLALKQAEEIINALKRFYPGRRYKIIGIDTYGDRDKTTPVSDIEGTDFFTKEIEDALSACRVDFAVHSAKDMPDEPREGLYIAAITKSIDPFDAVVSKNNLTISELPKGASLGVSSLRRKKQLASYRNDFRIVDIRGNVQERLDLLDAGRPTSMLDAIIVAACALKRLGLEGRIAQRIPFEILSPHPLQGSLAIEVKKDNKELIDFLKVLDGV